MEINLNSSAFESGDSIPKQFTCDGEDASPPLSWSGVPEGTLSLALILDDPDAPAGIWVHWVLFNIPPSLTSLPTGVQKDALVDRIGSQGNNDSRRTGYSGPCPPRGKPHRYYFKLYALDTTLNIGPGATKTQVEGAMQGHILAQGQIMGTYGR
jgi:Raf kinase inhibitor-like YbhB/YbcL family protein